MAKFPASQLDDPAFYTMSTILISYLRMESYEITRQIAERLGRQFGQQIVVMEELFFPFGIPTSEFIDKRVAKCDVLLSVIGPTSMEKHRGDRANHVQNAIESALKHSIPVIPVLVRGTQIPPAERLPESMQEILARGLEVRSDSHFNGDMDGLIESLTQSLNDRSQDSSS